MQVDYYGSMVPISQVAKVGARRRANDQGPAVGKEDGPGVEKAIRDSDLGLNPATQGDIVRVPMPALTEERRKELVKVVKHEGENAKVAVRNLRRDANDHMKELLKDKTISEDEERRAEDDHPEADRPLHRRSRQAGRREGKGGADRLTTVSAGAPWPTICAPPGRPELSRVPRHVAIIMDGNGRWAVARGLTARHRPPRGVEAVRDDVGACGERGIEYLTLFAFSSENWRRPAEEVSTLMRLFMVALRARSRQADRTGRAHARGRRPVRSIPTCAA